MTENNAGLVTRALTKTYMRGNTPVHALAGVDLTLPQGTQVAIMGPSGSGKTTLLHCLAGVLRPSSGSITLDGEEMTTAIGQGNTLVTPLHMALITATVANGGIMMKPYLVDHVEASDGSMVTKNSPSKYKRLMTTEEARIITDFMKETVASGTATALNGYGFTAAGKTGSAEYGANGTEGTHSWFVGFSNVDDPDLVVAVIAEDGGTGSQTAVPIAASVFQAYYSIKQS